ncbi:MAG TPA: hypothetical protein VN253_13305 [Kofleriaceae bacterium]|nr:hypothetical protein [Kofleriaceae bacterium]
MIAIGVLGAAARAEAQSPPTAATQEFLDEAKGLLVVGACADGAEPKVKAEVIAAHCKVMRAAQEDYKKQWLASASEFFKANVPAGVPKTVVYPFAGGDLATALTVYPDADEITTISLEPAGDPRALARLDDKELRASLGAVAKELGALYRYNYEKTMDMISAMTTARLPAQLIFSLSALWIHGYELTGMRYFTLTPEGDVRYLTADDAKQLDAIGNLNKRNREYGNVELRFRKKGGKEQVYRHLLANLDDAHLKASPAALRYLEKKGRVAGMTKAASYLLTFDNFNAMRKYLLDHVDWMVSDSTGLAPKYGTPAGFEYEMWGQYDVSNMPEGTWITPQWKALYAAQPSRPLKFRFGYPSGGPKYTAHLIIMRKAANGAAPAPAPAPAKPEPAKPAAKAEPARPAAKPEPARPAAKP